MAAPVYLFPSWVRQGLAGAIDTEMDASAAESRATVTAHVRVEGTRDGQHKTSFDVDKTTKLLGPGDSTTLDVTEIIRMYPTPDSIGVDPGRFPHVEFDSPDLPWRFSPGKATPAGLPPWLCLIAIERSVGVELKPGATLPTILATASDLPDLAEAKLWAHVQITSTDDEEDNLGVSPTGSTESLADVTADRVGLEDNLAKQPVRNSSRIICPQVLKPLTSYLACIVPTFAVGRTAGLGEPSPPQPLQWAWTIPQITDTQTEAEKAELTGKFHPVMLPVFHSWQFTTGEAADFEQLVRRLKACSGPSSPGCEALAGSGIRSMDVRTPGWNQNDKKWTDSDGIERELWKQADAETVWGALTYPKAAAFEHVASTDQTEAGARVERIRRLAELVSSKNSFGPPAYGRWHAGRSDISASDTSGWLYRLNSEPALRATAGLGARVVRERQEHLMAAIWRQLGEVRRANEQIRSAQFGAALATRTYLKRFLPERSDTNRTLKLMSPMLSRFRADPALPETVIGRIERESCVPSGLFSGAARKAFRPTGPLAKRVAKTLDFRQGKRIDLWDGIARYRDEHVEQQFAPNLVGASTLSEMSAEVARTVTTQMKAVGHDEAAIKSLIERLSTDPTPSTTVCTKLDKIAPDLLARAHPRLTVKRRVGAVVQLDEDDAKIWTEDEPIAPIIVSPRIDTPMWTTVRDISTEWLFPGLDKVPDDTIVGLAPNQSFVEAFMVGLNFEIGREMLWRGFPTDQRGTVFNHFWDTRRAAAEDNRQITDLHTWGHKTKLGDHSGAGAIGLVVLIRGGLFSRFPSAEVFMVPGELDTQGKRRPKSVGDVGVELPAFRGRLDPDVTFLGFTLAPDVYRGTPSDAGWWLAFQEQPTETTFGVAAAPETATSAPATWNDVDQGHISHTLDGAVRTAAGYVSIRKTKPSNWTNIKPAWRAESDFAAGAFLRHPFRLLVHCSDLIVVGS